MMKRKIQFRYSLISLMLLISGVAMGQTFWGTTPNDGHYGGGVIFSFDGQSDTYQTEYEFKGNPAYDVFNIFEESLNVYVGVCSRSKENGNGNFIDGNSIFRYNAITDTTQILFNYPNNSYHNYEIGDIIYTAHHNLISLSSSGDSLSVAHYNITNDTYQKFGYFSSKSYPAEGDYAYRTNACYFSEINDSIVIFSLEKVLGGESYAKLAKGRDFFTYNQHTHAINLLFNIPSTETYFPKGPFTTTTGGRIFAPMAQGILEIDVNNKSYTPIYITEDNVYIIDGEMIQATDSTIIGLKNISTTGYLFEYDFKNNSVITEQLLHQKGQFNAFVKRGDTVYFGGDNDKILAYHISSGNNIFTAYSLTEPLQGEIKYLINTSHEESIISFYRGLAVYNAAKETYISFVRFGGYGGYGDFKNGASPTADFLLASNGKLYGIAQNGGTGTFYHGDGLLYEIDPDTKAYQVLVNFTGKNGGFGDQDGYGTGYMKGQNNLVEVNQKIYGTTYTNGDYADKHTAPGYGVIYSYDLSKDSDNYHVVFDFNDSTLASAGRFPMSGMTLGANGKLYGTTISGGIKNGTASIYGHGVVYEIDPKNKDKFRVIIKIPEDSMPPIDNLVQADNGKFYGLASNAENSNTNWAIREYDMENQSFVDVYSSDPDKIEYNYSQFYYLNQKLYGVVKQAEGTNGYLFEYDIATSQLIQKVIFSYDKEMGSSPIGNLNLSSNGSFWGMAGGGGKYSEEWGDENKGVIYEFNPTDSVYTKHYTFGGIGGANPYYSSLVETAEANYNGTNTLTKEDQVKVYPNPTSDFVKIDFSDKGIQEMSYTIYDIQGMQLTNHKASVADYLILDLSGYPKGQYLIRIATTNSSFTKRIQRK